MAQIRFVVNYDRAGKLTIQTHVLKIDDTDKVEFTSPDSHVALKCEQAFPPLGLKKGEFVQIKHETRNAAVILTPEQYKFDCGYLMDGTVGSFKSQESGVGIPDGGGKG